jgi:hypothetical protein
MKIPVSVQERLLKLSKQILPDVIPGRVNTDELGEAEARDPDALPPRNLIEALGTRFHNLVTGLGGGNAVYAVKAGVLTS